MSIDLFLRLRRGKKLIYVFKRSSCPCGKQIRNGQEWKEGDKLSGPPGEMVA